MRHYLLPLIAASLIANAAAADPKASRFYEDALGRYEKNDMAGAIIQLKNALKIDDSNLSAHLLLSKALLRHGEVKAAEAALNQAIGMGINRTEVATTLAQVYLTLGQPDKVIDNVTTSGLPPTTRLEVLTLRGTAFAEMGKNVAASDSFAEARALDPRSAMPLIAEVPLLIRQESLAKAKETATKAVELAPTDAQASNALGSVLHAMKDLNGALAAYDKALSLAPGLAESRVARAAVLINMNRWADAEKDLSALDKGLVDEPRADYLRALVAAHKGDMRKAKDELQKSVKILDGLPRSWVASREHLLMAGAMSHYALKNWEKAREYLEPIVAGSTRNFLAQEMLASTYIETRDYDRAKRVLEGLIRSKPDDAQIQYMLGSVYLAQRRFSQASLLLEKAAAKGSTTNASIAAVRELGLSQIGSGKDSSGIANLEKAFAINPKDARTGTQLATNYARFGQPVKAVQTAEALAKSDPENLALLNFLGTVKGWIGDKAGARATYSKAIEKDANFLPALLNLARLDSAEGRLNDARGRLTNALTKRSSDADLLYELGLLEAKANKPTEAQRYWQKANDSQSADVRPALALIDLGITRGDFDSALTIAKQLTSKYSDQAPLMIPLGRVYLAMGDRASAQQTLRNAARIAGYDAPLQVQIGRLLLAAVHPDGAAFCAQMALQAKPDDEAALALQAETETVRNDASRADAALKTLATKYPNGVAVALTSANIAMARGQYVAAANAYRQALSRQPSSATAISVVQAHMAAGEPGKAIAFLDGWLKGHAEDRTALKALAEIQATLGQNEAARKTYATLLTTEPDDPLTLNNYAVLLQKLNDPKAAEPAENALRLLPGNPNIADTLGWIYVQQGKLDAGLRQLRDARLRSPENATIRYHLAYALQKSGRRNEAKEEMAAALPMLRPTQITGDVTRLKGELGL